MAGWVDNCLYKTREVTASNWACLAGLALLATSQLPAKDVLPEQKALVAAQTCALRSMLATWKLDERCNDLSLLSATVYWIKY